MNKREVLQYIVKNIKGPDFEKHSDRFVYDGMPKIKSVDEKIADLERTLEKYKKYQMCLDVVSMHLKSGNYNVTYNVVSFLNGFVAVPMADYNFIVYSVEHISTKRNKIKQIEKEIEALEVHEDYERSLQELFKKD